MLCSRSALLQEFSLFTGADIKESCSFQIFISLTAVAQPENSNFKSGSPQVMLMLTFCVLCLFVPPSTYLLSTKSVTFRHPGWQLLWVAAMNALDPKHLTFLNLKGLIMIPEYVLTNRMKTRICIGHVSERWRYLKVEKNSKTDEVANFLLDRRKH